MPNMTQAEKDAVAVGGLMAASKKVEDCLVVYESDPDNLRNLNALSAGFIEYISNSFNFLMLTGCKPPQEYQDKADKYEKLLRPVGDRLTQNKNKLAQTIERHWDIFLEQSDNKGNAEKLIENLEEFLNLFGQQKDSKRQNKLYAKAQKILRKRNK